MTHRQATHQKDRSLGCPRHCLSGFRPIYCIPPVRPADAKLTMHTQAVVRSQAHCQRPVVRNHVIYDDVPPLCNGEGRGCEAMSGRGRVLRPRRRVPIGAAYGRLGRRR